MDAATAAGGSAPGAFPLPAGAGGRRRAAPPSTPRHGPAPVAAFLVRRSGTTGHLARRGVPDPSRHRGREHAEGKEGPEVQAGAATGDSGGPGQATPRVGDARRQRPPASTRKLNEPSDLACMITGKTPAAAVTAPGCGRLAGVDMGKATLGGARVRNVPLRLTCWRCDQSFEVTTCGREPRLCPTCRASHRRCPACERVLPLDLFFVSQGSGSRCRACCARPPTQYICGGCCTPFVRTNRGSDVAVHLCNECERKSKFCPRCNEVKPLDRFNISRGKRSGRVAHCKACYQRKNAARSPAERLVRVTKKYNMSPTEWTAMHTSQQGLCMICNKLPTPDSRGRTLVVDHDHRTGAVRGLLCLSCNIGIGHLQDDPVLLQAAAEYLMGFESM